jgi:hypothetical protein
MKRYLPKKAVSIWLFSVVIQFSPAVLSLNAQGIIFFSNLAETSTGDVSTGADSWIAPSFITGTNHAGYELGYVDILTTPALGNPSGLILSVYGRSDPTNLISPGTSLGTLNGSDPITGGVHRFTASGITLDPQKLYFLVASASSPIIDGSFQWSVTTSDAAMRAGFGSGGFYSTSADGSSWSSARDQNFQFAISAIPIPEPSTFSLLGLGGLFVVSRALKRRASRGR